MSLDARTLFSIAALTALAACSADVPPTAVPDPALRAGSPATGAVMRFTHARVCAAAPLGFARCHSWVRVDPNTAEPLGSSTPTSGYNPSDLRLAYNITGTGSSTTTIAIVDAYDDPNAESDLAVYRSQWGLPPCTTANGCFRKVDQNGGTNYPRSDRGWAQEISLDLDMASAMCPNCHILLVEAKTNAFTNLAAAVKTAANLGANAISNSYGGSEFSSEGSSTYDGAFNHPGIAVTVSSGDNGYGVEFPAASEYVTAVGGTSLTRDATTTRGWRETAWSGAGSGCSLYIPKPSWQHDTGCSMRTVADVSAVADPNTGVAVYDSFHIKGGWLVFGGTSVSSPIIAGVYAVNGGGATYGSDPYAHTSALFDIVSGSNGSCGGTYLCTAGTGYDGPTGLGTPNGTTAF